MSHSHTDSEPSPHAEQLAFERRFGLAAAAAAVGSVMAQLAAVAVAVSVGTDAPKTNDKNEVLVAFRQFDKHESEALLSALAQALSYVFAALAVYYLFKATRYRRAELSPAFGWLLVVGPLLLLAAAFVAHGHTADLVDQFLASGPQTNARAKAIAEENLSGLGQGLSAAGPLAVGSSFLVTSLNAMRAGLLSQFMGILGIVIGALVTLQVVFPIGGLGLIQLFWMGALAFLFLDRWPGGRGPAWATGQAEEWPRPARRALVAPPAQKAESEPLPERPASRKRRKNR